MKVTSFPTRRTFPQTCEHLFRIIPMQTWVCSLSVLFQTTVKLYPFQIHSIALSSFASIMGPFGGFFASGFKRAFKIKVRDKPVHLPFFSHIFIWSKPVQVSFVIFLRFALLCCRTSPTPFLVTEESWTASTVSTSWPPSSTSTSPASSGPAFSAEARPPAQTHCTPSKEKTAKASLWSFTGKWGNSSPKTCWILNVVKTFTNKLLTADIPLPLALDWFRLYVLYAFNFLFFLFLLHISVLFSF